MCARFLRGNDAGPTVDPSIQPAADAMKDQKAASLVQAYNSKHRGESLVESYRRQVHGLKFSVSLPLIISVVLIAAGERRLYQGSQCRFKGI